MANGGVFEPHLALPPHLFPSQFCNSNNGWVEVQWAIGKRSFSSPTLWDREREKPPFEVLLFPPLKVTFTCNDFMSRAHTLPEKVTPSRKGTMTNSGRWEFVPVVMVEFSAVRTYNTVFFWDIKNHFYLSFDVTLKDTFITVYKSTTVERIWIEY